MAADSPTPGTETRHSCPYCGAAPLNVYSGEEPGIGDTVECSGPGCGAEFVVPAAPSPVGTTEPPAETQQDGGLCDDRGPRIGSEGTPRCRRPLGHDGPHRPAEEDGWGMAMSWGNLSTAALAARPSADAETLADRFISGALDNIGAFDGSNDEARDRADVRAQLIALLDGSR